MQPLQDTGLGGTRIAGHKIKAIPIAIFQEEHKGGSYKQAENVFPDLTSASKLLYLREEKEKKTLPFTHTHTHTPFPVAASFLCSPSHNML